MNQKALITIVVVVLLLVGSYFLIRLIVNPASPDEQELVTCGSGKPVYRYKYPSKAFPVISNEYSLNFALATDVLNKINDTTGNATLNLDAKNKVVELQEKLNQDNITFTAALKNYFFSCNADPCNDSLRIRYAIFTEEMSKRMIEYKKFVAQVTYVEHKGSQNTKPITSSDIKLITDTSKIFSALMQLNESIITK
jgi:hypothetical protein